MPLSLITWNIQWGRGCDGRVDLRRIVDTARAMADFDVLCLQEVARNFPGLPGSRGEDQFRLLADLLPGYAAIEGIGTDVLVPEGTPARSQFGNMILTRLPVLQAFRHLLPWPADPDVPSMQRVAVEAVLQAPFADATPYYVDSWQIMHPDAPHPPTLGVFDREQWPEPFTCDFIFVTGDLGERVREVRVNSDTDASDHQPVLLSLEAITRTVAPA